MSDTNGVESPNIPQEVISGGDAGGGAPEAEAPQEGGATEGEASPEGGAPEVEAPPEESAPEVEVPPEQKLDDKVDAPPQQEEAEVTKVDGPPEQEKAEVTKEDVVVAPEQVKTEEKPVQEEAPPVPVGDQGKGEPEQVAKGEETEQAAGKFAEEYPALEEEILGEAYDMHLADYALKWDIEEDYTEPYSVSEQVATEVEAEDFFLGVGEGEGEGEGEDEESEAPEPVKKKVIPDILPGEGGVETEYGFLRGAPVTSELLPFTLYWCHGVNPTIAIHNLSNDHRTAVAFVNNQMATIFDINTREMRVLEGHVNPITGTSLDATGKYFVTADVGPDHLLTIWDTYEATAILTMYDIFQDEVDVTPHTTSTTLNEEKSKSSSDSDKVVHPGASWVAISPNAKYLVAVGNIKPIIKFWLWTFGRDEPDATYTIRNHCGACMNISFNPNAQEHIMLTFEFGVYFFQWNPERHTLDLCSNPPIKAKNKWIFGPMNDATYIEHCHECMTSTNNGYVHVFGNSLYKKPYDEAPSSNDKIYVKTIRLMNFAQLLCLTSVDGLVVIGDDMSRIWFFDNSLRILYWCQNFKSLGVESVSFKLEPRRYKIIDAEEMGRVPERVSKVNTEDDFLEDRSEAFEMLFKNMVPEDATQQRRPFVTRDFCIQTTAGDIVHVDFLRQIYTPLFKSHISKLVAIDCHKYFPLLVLGYATGRICLYNYELLEEVTCQKLPVVEVEPDDDPVTVTSLRYSPNSYRLACGRSNGELWFLEPILQKIMCDEPFTLTSNTVLDISFSSDSNYCAYYDQRYTTCLLRYDHSEQKWIAYAKMRAHFDDIRGIMFSTKTVHSFFTIGRDRYLVEYDADKSTEGVIEIVRRVRIEQSALPLCFNFLLRHPEEIAELQIIYADDQFKYKTILESNFQHRQVRLGPTYGCYRDNPVVKIINLPGHDYRYFVFVTKNHIGLQAVPVTGNPYSFLGILAHSNELMDVISSFDGRYVFTIGQGDSCFMMWKTNTSSIMQMERIGGKNLNPYYCLIEGGATGWLFKEIQDLFFYMQILHQDENTTLPRNVSDFIPIVEVPDLMRACGFFPTEFEICNLILDLKYLNLQPDQKERTDISFTEFIQAYINHRPAHGISAEELERVFGTVLDLCEGQNYFIDRDDFIDALCETGEMFSPHHAQRCLAVLMNEELPANAPVDFDFLPQEIGFNTLMVDLLGLDLDSFKKSRTNSIEKQSQNDDAL